jgi:hypothetical protein
LFKLKYTSGKHPKFIESGVAIDDKLIIGGSTFKTSNQGVFTIIGVNNESLIFKNEFGEGDLHTIRYINNLNTLVQWISNGDYISGQEGAFKNANIGDWIKKEEDSDSKYVQIIDLVDDDNISTTSILATKALLGSQYTGTTSLSQGVVFDQLNDVNQGILLRSYDDIKIIEGDSAFVGDNLFIDNYPANSWFNPLNSGIFTIEELGSESSNFKPYIKITNNVSISESNILLSANKNGFFIKESDNNKYESYRFITNTEIDSFDNNKRIIYLNPATKVNKLSSIYETKIKSEGKLSYSTNIINGIDGYTYYTGLLRTVQRVIDGYEPNSEDYPGRRACGGTIEIMPPLIQKIKISADITTNKGINLNDLVNDVKSSIISYVNNLGVGEDVIISEIIVKIMDIIGVAAVTITTPAAGTERISVTDKSKAYIEPSDISVS